MKKCARVICTYFGERRKTYNTPSDPFVFLLKNIENEIKKENGFPTDLIIVNNTIYKFDKEYILNIYKNKDTKNGKIIIEHRHNIGGPFGAFYDIFLKYRNDYDYWFFSEDDVFIYEDNITKEFIDFLDSDEEYGFVSLAPLSNAKEHPKHSGGGAGLTSTEKFLIANPIDEIIDVMLNLNVVNSYSYFEGLEIYFTNVYVKKDLKLVNHPKYSPVCRNFERVMAHKHYLHLITPEMKFIYDVGE